MRLAAKARPAPSQYLRAVKAHPTFIPEKIEHPGASPSGGAKGGEGPMNYFRTAILLAGLTALFMGVGYLIGGPTGGTIALLVAGGMNLFAYWNSDRMVLSMHGAQEVDARSAPDLVRMVSDLAGRAGLPMPRVYLMDNPQPNAF